MRFSSMPKPAKCLKYLLLCVCAGVMLAGCSRIYIAYHAADIFIEQYADDYLALDSSQLADWQPTLNAALSRHRQDELPYLARFFDTAYLGARQGFKEARVVCLLEQFEDLYRRHFRIGVSLAAPLLADLTQKQIRKLEREFAEESEDPAENDAGSVARRNRKRAERFSESLEWWLGSVSRPQETIIREVTAAMPDTAGAWEAYRGAKQAGLIGLLDRRANEDRIRRYLDDWLVEYRDLPPALSRARLRIHEEIIELFIRMDATLSKDQRNQFADRLRSIRDDFMSLQKRPKMARSSCT